VFHGQKSQKVVLFVVFKVIPYWETGSHGPVEIVDESPLIAWWIFPANRECLPEAISHDHPMKFTNVKPL